MSNMIPMIGIAIITIVLLIASVCGTSPTRRPSYNTPKCPLTATITCSVKVSGQPCSTVTVPYSNQCDTGTLVSYLFKYCNINNFQVKLDPTKSVIRSDFANFTFTSWSIPSSTCVTLPYDGVLKHCNVTSYAILMLTGTSPRGVRCYAFQQLSLLPKFLVPSNRPSRTPSKKPMRKPTRKPSRKPTSRPSMFPRSVYPTTKPSRKPSPRKPTLRPTMRKPSMDPTAKPSLVLCNMYPKQRRQEIIYQLSSAGVLINATSISNTTATATSSSPQAKALSWLIDYDGLQLCAGDTRIIQRYILTVFYFSTLGDDTWNMCGRFSINSCNVNLTVFPNDPIVTRYGMFPWLSAVDECLWGGLACKNATGTIDRIEFSTYPKDPDP